MLQRTKTLKNLFHKVEFDFRRSMIGIWWYWLDWFLLEGKREMLKGSKFSKSLSQIAKSNMRDFFNIFKPDWKTLQRREFLKTLFQRIQSIVCEFKPIFLMSSFIRLAYQSWKLIERLWRELSVWKPCRK